MLTHYFYGFFNSCPLISICFVELQFSEYKDQQILRIRKLSVTPLKNNKKAFYCYKNINIKK